MRDRRRSSDTRRSPSSSYRHLRLFSGQQARAFRDAAHGLGPFDRVDVDAPDPGRRFERSRLLDRDRASLRLGVRRLVHSVEDLPSDRETRHLRQTIGLLRGSQHQDAREDRNVARAVPPYLDQPLAERGEVKDGLRLKELGARGDLVHRLHHVGVHRLGEWRRRRADDELRRTGFDLVARQEAAIAEAGGHFHEPDAVEVLDVDGVRMASLFRVVAAHEHEILDAERGRPEHIGLQRDAVAIASGHLDDGLDARVRMITAAATAAIATIARFESVTLTASTKPLRASARRRTTVADALFGGLSSAVTMKPLPRRRSASALNEKDLSFSMRGLPVRSTPLIFPRAVLGRNWHRSGTPPVAEASSGRSLSLSR